MNETKLYLETLAKIMDEEGRFNPNENNDSYDRLYSRIHDDLTAILERSQYPNSPAIIKQTDEILEAISSLYILPELREKAIGLITIHWTNELFRYDFFNTWFENNITDTLGKYKTQIPFVVISGDTEGIEVLNYANCRIPISLTEYIHLVTQSGENRIALNRIIQFFILHIPSVRKGKCIVLDNVYGDADKYLSRIISTRILILDNKGLELIFDSKRIEKYDAISTETFLMEKISSNPFTREHCIIPIESLPQHFLDDLHPILLGFSDELICMETQIKAFYCNLIDNNKNMLNLITSDLVNSEGNDKTLMSVKAVEQERKELNELEYRELCDVFKKIFHDFEVIQNEIHDNIQYDTIVPRKVINCVFRTLFYGMDIDSHVGQYTLSRLIDLKYDDCALAESYIAHNKKVVFRKVNDYEWEKAKMFLELANLDILSEDLLNNYVTVLTTEGFTTGKEYYAKSMTLRDSKRTEFLQKSLLRGYTPAADALIREYKSGNTKVDLNMMANALIPEACMLKAEKVEKKQSEDHSKYQSKRFMSIDDNILSYYKIAASQEFAPAIEKIVDMIFESRFQNIYQLYGDDFDDERFYGMIDDGHAIIPLCYYLIERSYKVNHFREILGIVYFCLNENLSESMHLLSGINTSKANYCKGSLYEYGRGGLARDLSQALSHYKKAKEQGYPAKYIDKKISRCEDKIEKQIIRKESDINYQNDYDYSATYSDYSSHKSSSSWCFITTAACRALKAQDDCDELMLLRDFRDSHLQIDSDGEAIVSEYYRIAPILIEHIDKLEDPWSKYQFLWEEYIGPSCDMIREGKYDEAKWVYIRMVESLCCEFSVSVRPQILRLLET